MKKITILFSILAFSTLAFSQVSFKIELLPDNATYRVSMVPAVTYSFPQNITTSGQVTIKVSHGLGGNSFQLVNLSMLTPGADWSDNVFVASPPEAPSWDYISFGLQNLATSSYTYQAGVEIPLFSFQNGAAACTDSIELFDNQKDPFLSPNSIGVNVENSLVVLGGGLNNSYAGNIGSGSVPCTPATTCEDIDNTFVQLCDGEAYQGTVFLQDTTLEEHYTTYLGCDSGFVVDIKVGASAFATVDTSVCKGESFNGTPIQQNQTMVMTLVNSGGCDSVVTYNIQVLQPASTVSDTLILPGQIFAGTAIFSDTTVVFHYTGSNGCDSLHSVQVGIYQVPVTLQDTTLCQGTPFNGTIYLQSTTVVDTLTGNQGFDSLLLTNIFVNPTYVKFQTVPLCQGSVYQNVAYFQDTVLVENFPTLHGCDSTIYTTLDVQMPTILTLDTSICFGEFFQGSPVTNDTLLKTAILSAHGCDSIVFLSNIAVLPAANAVIQGKTAICHGEPITLSAYGGATYEWNTGETSKSIQPAIGGDYAVTVTNNFGCRDVATHSVSDSDPSAEIVATHPGCDNGGDGAIVFTNFSGGEPPYSFSIDGGNLYTTHSQYNNLLPGRYDAMMKDKNGCIWEQLVDLVDPFDYELELLPDTAIELGGSIQLKVFTNLFQPAAIEWWPAAGLDCTDCLEPQATPFETTTYHLRLTDSTGCSFDGKVQITVDRAERLFVPTAFSPNDDGINDRLFVFTGENVTQIHRFSIFNRWGVQLFTAENFQPADAQHAWDGYWQGEKAPTGTYAWIAQVEYLDGKVVLYQGSVALLR